MKLNDFHKLLLILAHSGIILAAAAPSQEILDFCQKKEAIPVDDGKGGWNCQFCAGNVYRDPKTGLNQCCGFGTTFKTDPAALSEGACCQATEHYSFDSATQKGLCCPLGQSFRGGLCQPPAPPPPVPTPSPKPSPSPSPSPAAIPSEPVKSACPTCSNTYACACDGNLGIKYGSCYSLIDTNGQPLNRDLANVYQTGAEISNLVFRVCKSTKDCDELSGTPVPETGTWVLQDQLGDRVNPGPGWMVDSLPHFSVVTAAIPSHAAVFKGEPFCFYGECSICLRLAEGVYTGLSAPCPMGTLADKTHLGAAINPNNCKAYRFQEIACVKGVPGKPKA